MTVSSDEGEDNVPLAQRRAPKRAAPVSYADSSDDDVPLARSRPSANGNGANGVNGHSNGSGPAAKKVKVKSEPLTPKKAKSETKSAPKSTTKSATKPLAKSASKSTPKPANAAAKASPSAPSTPKSSSKSAIKSSPKTPKPIVTPKSKPVAKKEGSESANDDDDDDESKETWWNASSWEDGEEKWQTLEHNGVLFPPPYDPLPKGVHLVYDGHPVELHPEAEEVAGFFGAMLSSDHTKNPVFQTNFFTDFVEVVKETGGARINGKKAHIESFEKCDFTKIFEHYEKARNEKKALSSAEKKAIKAAKDAAEEVYKSCLIDGRKEPVGNFRIEPPGLFRGRGQHPKTGKLKARVKPEQVTINIGKDAPVPEPPAGHQWNEVKHDNTVTWLANWKENINGNNKYVLLAQSSSFKGKSDFKKFEKARELKKHVDAIRLDYYKELDDKVMEKRQRATAMYLIDVFALRAGGEKGEDEADTVGCCSLRYEHITLSPPNVVEFDFLGKDSIRYYQRAEVDNRVFRNLRIFKKPPKGPGDDVFDRLDPPTLNKHLQNYMPGLTAKVFRTFNASYTMQKQLDLIKNSGSVNEKVVEYNAANREVAILCNHQRGVTSGHAAAVSKIGDKIIELKWHKIRLKRIMLALEPKLKKKEPKYFEELESLTKTQIEDVQTKMLEREKVKIEKKFQRENEKLLLEGGKAMPEKELKERLKEVAQLEKEYKKELKGAVPEYSNSTTVEKLKLQVDKYDERITNTTLQLKDKEDNSTVSLGTSKMNYIDPRLTVMFSKRFGVPIEKLFTKTLREKFAWAIETADEDWEF